MWKEGIKNCFEDEDIVKSLSQYQRNGDANVSGPLLWKPKEIEASLDSIDDDLKNLRQSPDTTALDEDDPPSFTCTQFLLPKTDKNIYCVSKSTIINLTQMYHPKSCDQKSKDSRCLSVCMKKLIIMAPSSESKCPNCYCLLSEQEKTSISITKKISSQKYYSLPHAQSEDSLDIPNLLDLNQSGSNMLSQVESIESSAGPQQSATITSSDDFSTNWQDDFIIYKSSLRIPSQLIRIPKIRQLPFRAGSLQYFYYCRQILADKKECFSDAQNSLCDSTSVVFNNKSNQSVPPLINNFKSSVNRSKNVLTNLLQKFPFLLKTNNKRKLLARQKIAKYEKCFLHWTMGQTVWNNMTSNNISNNFLFHLKQSLQVEKIRKKSVQKALDILGKQKGQNPNKKYCYNFFEYLKQVRRAKSQAANRRHKIAKKNATLVNKSTGETLLHRAARRGIIEKVVYLLEEVGLDPNAQDHAGYTPLHESCLYAHLHVARCLLHYGAEPNCTALNGIRPMHDAVENEDIEMIRLLLSYGANPLLNPLSATPIKEFFQGFMGDVTGEIGEWSQIKPWLFNGSASIFDASVTGYDLFYNVPDEGKDEDFLIFDLSKQAQLPLYKLEKFVRSNSYFLLQDVLNQLEMSRGEFTLIHTDLEVVSIGQPEFIHQFSNNQLLLSHNCDKIELLVQNQRSHAILDIQRVFIPASCA